MPDDSAAKPIVISYREVHQAFQESPAAAEVLGDEGSDLEKAMFLMALGEAMRQLEEEDAAADPDVLTVPRSAMASRMLSLLADDPPEGSTLEDLEAGGQELKFAKNDIFGWLKSLFDWTRRETFHPLLRPNATQAEAIAGKVRIALLSDWGTALYGAPKIAETLEGDAGRFDYLLHLGDVYYSGTEKEVESRFLSRWPRRDDAVSRALNANHEMYSGGHGYFDKVLPAFGQKSSYFALANDHWLLVCLDSAYVDDDLDDLQLQWLRTVVAGAGDRKVVLFSHHQLFSWFESQGEKLAAKLGDLLTAGRIFAWYWGHEHRCCLYQPSPLHGGLHARCVGHGGMPLKRGKVEELSADHAVGDAVWRRRDARNMVPGGLVLDGPNPFIKGKEEKYLPHGYMTLEFDGPHLHETVLDPTGAELFSRQLA